MVVLLAAVSMLLAACGGGTTDLGTDGSGGDDSPVTTQANNDAGTDSGGTDSGDSGDAGEVTDDGDGVTPEASGPLGENTIRIGDQTWERTLPMTTGQCFLFEDDGTLPDSASAWGTLDNDEDLRFSARFNQDGTFESEVSNNHDMYWGSGPRFGEDDLVVELDFETLTISGSGTYSSLITGERAMGSFQFTCEAEE